MGRSHGTADFRALFESAPDLYLALAPDAVVLAASDAYLRASGARRDAIVGRRLDDAFPEGAAGPIATSTSKLRASLARVLETRAADAMDVAAYDAPAVGAARSETRHGRPRSTPVLGADGEVRYVLHRVEDVTAEVRAVERASQLEAEIQRASDELRRLREELGARVEARTDALHRANVDLYEQITERRKTEDALTRAEEQLRQAQKLEAVGRLAGGVAHDFNNMLSVILSYAAILLSELEEEAPGRAEIEQIKIAGERAAALTHQLLAFSRQQVLDLQVLDVNEVLEGLHKMLARVLGEDVDLALRTAPHALRIRADRSQLEQVVMNLVVNSRDAMPGGGRLTIEVSEIELDADYSRMHPGVAPGSYAVLAVSDNGVGMDAETQARMFEPFFTTKERGRGTGLGLSTVFGIVRQIGGHIWVYSEKGSGTTFKIYLPEEHVRATGELPARPASVPPTAQARGTILIAEDQEQVRAVAGNILRKAGYDVVEASTPEEALAAFAEDAPRIDLLLTDVVMPRMSGRQLAENARALQPDVRVVFMSGYTDDAIVHHGVLEPGVVFVEKPLTPDALTRKVHEALSGSLTAS